MGKTVEVLVERPLAGGDTKAILGSRLGDVAEAVQVPLERLQASLAEIVAAASETFDVAAQSAVGQFKLKEIEVQLEITAEGGVRLVGTASVGVKGAMTLRFIR